MLAKDVNDDTGIQNARGALRFFASKLAPTGERHKKTPMIFRPWAFFIQPIKASRPIDNRRAPRQANAKPTQGHALPLGVHHVLFQQQRNAR